LLEGADDEDASHVQSFEVTWVATQNYSNGGR